MRLIDSHSHLNLPEFKKDLDEVIKRAKENYVIHTVVIGINPSTNKKALELSQVYPDFISPVIGFHPHEVKNLTEEDYQELEANLDKVYAIGEIGLDWVKEYSPKEMQIEHFERQLELAKKHKKCVVLHLRGDESLWETAFTIIKKFLPLKFLSHCFTSDKNIARKILDLGGFISIPGIVTFQNAHSLREAVTYIPLDRLLIETDCPFLAPVPFRGKRNEPAFLIYTAQKIAEVKGLSLEEIAEKTTENTIQFFKLPIK
jgi:TatD DNase family protein